ncbi:hypothetical protein [Carnobacterium funditum]|nr:hypothetical protein [Carnobacterium funditum]
MGGTKDGSVIAELGVPWCGPSKLIAPVLKEIFQVENGIIRY